ERIRRLLRELDLDLAKARATGDRGRARHRVVVDLGQQTALLVEQECLTTTRVDRRDLHEWSGPGPWPHQARGESRRRARVTRERMLGARHARRGPRLGKFDGPTVVGAVAKAHA